MPPASVPATSPSAFVRWLPALGLLLWAGGAVGGWLLARRAGWGAGELVIAGSVWLLVLLVAARQLLRDLFGPVFSYEVMRVGRRTSTFVFRWIYIGLIVGLLALLYFSWSHSVERYGDRVPPVRLAEFATLYFEVVAVIQFVVVILLTPGYVAGTISNEKERQTLEFLLATDLRNREIVFGKLAARTITLGMYVLAGLPVIAFLQLFGGIDPDLALASTAAAVITVIGLSAVSLMFSTALKKSRDAIAVTYLVMIGYIAVSFTLAIVVQMELVRKNMHLSDLGIFVIDWQQVTEWFAAGNPLWTYPNATRGGRVIDADAIAQMLGRFAAFWGIVTVLALVYAVTRRATSSPPEMSPPCSSSGESGSGYAGGSVPAPARRWATSRCCGGRCSAAAPASG
jgi:ABC-type transport system involved in multi-copper enzyme maturation permease subunit